MPFILPMCKSHCHSGKKQIFREGHGFHLVSDLDGTWIPTSEDVSGLRTLEGYLDSRPDITLTFATGRTLESALSLMAAHITREPSHLVTDIGTGLYHRHASGEWREDLAYSEFISNRWNPELRQKMEKEGLPKGLHFQAGINPPRRLALEVSDSANLMIAATQLQLMLYRMGVAADVLTSNQYCIDILPMDVDKGTALRFLEERENTPRPMIACGDSENDIGLWRLADIAFVMADSPVDMAHSAFKAVQWLRPSQPGPKGILDSLVNLENTLAAEV